MPVNNKSTLGQLIGEICHIATDLTIQTNNLRENLKNKKVNITDDEKLPSLIKNVGTLDFGDSDLESVFKVNIQIEEPFFKEYGDIWVKSESSGNIYFKTDLKHVKVPIENDIFIKLYDVTLNIILNKSFNFISDKGELIIRYTDEKILQNDGEIFSGEILFNNIMKVFGKIGNIMIYKNGKWSYAKAFWWNGEKWINTCKLDIKLYSILDRSLSPSQTYDYGISIYNPTLELEKTYDFKTPLGINNLSSHSSQYDFIGIDKDDYIYIFITKGDIIAKISPNEEKIIYAKTYKTPEFIKRYPKYSFNNYNGRYFINPNTGEVYIRFFAEFATGDPLRGITIAKYNKDMELEASWKGQGALDSYATNLHFHIPGKIILFGQHSSIIDDKTGGTIDVKNEPNEFTESFGSFFGPDGNWWEYGYDSYTEKAKVLIYDKNTAKVLKIKEVNALDYNNYENVMFFSPIDDCFYTKLNGSGDSNRWIGKYDSDFNLIDKKADIGGFYGNEIIHFFDKDRNIYSYGTDTRESSTRYSRLRKIGSDLNSLKDVDVYRDWLKSDYTARDISRWKMFASLNPIEHYYHSEFL